MPWATAFVQLLIITTSVASGDGTRQIYQNQRYLGRLHCFFFLMQTFLLVCLLLTTFNLLTCVHSTGMSLALLHNCCEILHKILNCSHIPKIYCFVYETLWDLCTTQNSLSDIKPHPHLLVQCKQQPVWKSLCQKADYFLWTKWCTAHILRKRAQSTFKWLGWKLLLILQQLVELKRPSEHINHSITFEPCYCYYSTWANSWFNAYCHILQQRYT